MSDLPVSSRKNTSVNYTLIYNGERSDQTPHVISHKKKHTPLTRRRRRRTRRRTRRTTTRREAERSLQRFSCPSK